MFVPNSLTKLSFHVLDINFIHVYSLLGKPLVQKGWTPLLILEFLFVLTFFVFCRCMFFLILMQGRKVDLFHLNLAQRKSSSFLVSMVSFVTFQSMPFFKGINERLGKS
jgi:hypothetical protein